MSGYTVILDVGMSGKEVDFPDANCWTYYKGTLKIGNGEIGQFGDFKGDKHGSFRKGKVAGIIDLE